MIRVVIADDEEKVCQLIVGLVDWRALGMEVVAQAHDGVEALAKVEALRPDVLITDIRMPGYDGLELIERARLAQPELAIVIISGYRHFEYAQTAVHYGVGEYLLKPIKQKELEQTLETIAGHHRQRQQQLSDEEERELRRENDIVKLREGLFTDFLLKAGQPAPALEELNQTYHYAFEPGPLQVVVVKLNCGHPGDIRPSLAVVLQKTRQVMADVLGAGRELALYSEGVRLYCVMQAPTGSERDTRKLLRRALEELQLQKNVFEEFTFTIGCGPAVEDVAALPASLEAAQLALDERLVPGTGPIIEPVLGAGRRAETTALLGRLNKGMDTALAVLDREGVLGAVDVLQEEIAAAGDLSGRDISHLATEALNTFVMLLRSHGLERAHQEGLAARFAARADLFGTAADLLGFLRSTVETELDAAVEERRQAESKPIRKAKHYILQNYSQALTLEALGSMSGFSPAYFSTLFKKETGSGFAEFLAKVRMDKAKELLKETDLRVDDVCRDVGYSDLKHFAKSFKKATGLKPGEYRKLYS